MSPAPWEGELLGALAEMPFLDRLELAAVTGWSRGAVYRGVGKLEDDGLTASVPHGTGIIATTRRYHPTADGLRRLAGVNGVAVDDLLKLPSGVRPLAAHPAGTAGRTCLRLPAGGNRVQPGASHPVPLVPGRAAGRRHLPPRRAHPGHSPAGSHRRPYRLRQADMAAGRGAAARRRAGHSPRRGAPQARPPAAGPHSGCGAAGPGAGRGPGRAGPPHLAAARRQRGPGPELRAGAAAARRRNFRRGTAVQGGPS